MRLVAFLLALPSCRTGACTDEPSTHASQSSPGPTVAPVLRLISPHNGDQLELPAAVTYEVDALPSGAIRLFSGASPTGFHKDFPLTESGGSITLPDDKTLTGLPDSDVLPGHNRACHRGRMPDAATFYYWGASSARVS